MKSQAAMEYLTTYGWAILIIAIVLVVLFSLNLFNPYTFAPKAQPGSCSVQRQSVAGLSRYALVGPCKNEIPQYVTQFNGKGYINVGYSPTLNLPQSMTITAWVYQTAACASHCGVVVQRTLSAAMEYGLDFNSPRLRFNYYTGTSWFDYAATTTSVLDRWTFVAVTRNIGTSNSITYYESGSQVALDNSSIYASGTYASNVIFGADLGFPGFFDGYISNIQIYNTSLSSNGIRALYQEGIGGTPIDIQHLAGWWPLNGNANDYSGNGNSGNAVNVTYTSNWENGYTIP